ncbi:MAG: hypothetical protein A2W04_01215 [Betaproteobacteria bacterium RBG_16_64_9]|nr:MAG: hypothetical protein A2W04_01215 [Betaproteobacteria bacterium RBG_16_64_9]OGA95271.1 MAG: hypothetical protein A3G27_06175 [Betaproteobacteria bacterium RIFCSPLOWO2_12_FULL_66_14]
MRRALRTLLVAICLAAPAVCLSQAGPAPSLKAEYLYRFLLYVTWPADRFLRLASPIVVGVVADDALASELRRVTTDREPQGRPVVVRSLRPTDSLSEVHAVFYGSSMNPMLAQLIASATGSVLIVTEAQGGLALGSVINLILEDQRLLFEVNLEEAKKRRLGISASLLSAAVNVAK